MGREISETHRAGVWISVIGELSGTPPEIPEGVYAAVVTANQEWFAVDTAGNVRGNPEAVEREAMTLGIDENLVARGVVGLARLARSRFCLFGGAEIDIRSGGARGTIF